MRRVVLPVSILVAIVGSVVQHSPVGKPPRPELRVVPDAPRKDFRAPRPILCSLVPVGQVRLSMLSVVASELEGELETAEKVVLTLGSELDRNLAYRTYAKYRGIPKVLAIEMSFEHRSELADEQNSLVAAHRSNRPRCLRPTSIRTCWQVSVPMGNASLSRNLRGVDVSVATRLFLRSTSGWEPT